jgi:hypothetical protein
LSAKANVHNRGIQGQLLTGIDDGGGIAVADDWSSREVGGAADVEVSLLEHRMILNRTLPNKISDVSRPSSPQGRHVRPTL